MEDDQDEVVDSDEELNSSHDDDDDDDDDDEDDAEVDDEDYDEDDDEDDDGDSELDDISVSELEAMAASTQRSLFMVQMQLASRRSAEEQGQQRMIGIDAVVGNDFDAEQRQEDGGGGAAGVGGVGVGNLLDRWQEFLDALPRSKIFKITDAYCQDIIIQNVAAGHLNPHQVAHDLITTIASPQVSGLTHAILGGELLQVLKDQQRHLFQALWTRHCTTLTYLKLGTTESPVGHQGGLDMESFCWVLKLPPTQPLLHPPLQQFPPQQTSHGTGQSILVLTEMELCSVTIYTVDQISGLVEVLGCAIHLKQLNLLGLHVDQTAVQQHQRLQQVALILDPILATVAELSRFDECRLSCRAPSSVPLVSPSCLAHMLTRKPKWWRLALDGVGLEDQHCQVLAQAMSHETCKAGDLLSLTMNPAVSRLGWNQLFDALFQKQRMGLVKVDDMAWQATFDLVRSMNNLHGRLSYLESGTYASRALWIEWLAKLSQISWEDDAHKTNYLWFTLLERPDYVHN